MKCWVNKGRRVLSTEVSGCVFLLVFYCVLKVIVELVLKLFLVFFKSQGLALWIGGHIPWGKGSGGSGLLLGRLWSSEVILEVVLEDNRLWKPSNPGQEGLVPSDKVTIHSGVILCSWSFRGWYQIPSEVPATPGPKSPGSRDPGSKLTSKLHQGGGGVERRFRQAIEIVGRRSRPLRLQQSLTTDIRHIQEKNNPVADTFFWIQIDHLSALLGTDFAELAAAQARDLELPAVRMAVTGLWLAEMELGTHWLWCDTSIWKISTVGTHKLSEADLRPAPWVGLSKSPRLSPVGSGAICLAQAQPRRHSVGKILCGLPTDQGALPHWLGGRDHPRPRQQVWSAPHRPRGAASPIRGTPVPPNRGWPVHLLVGGFTSEGDLDDRGCQGICWPLGVLFQHPSGHHLGQRTAVHLPAVEIGCTGILGMDLRQTTAYHPQSNGMVE